MNRIRTPWIVALVVGAALAVAVAQSEGDEAQRASDYFQEFQAAPYTDWAAQPDAPEGFYVGQEPHGMLLRSFANEVAVQDAESGADTFSDGAVIVKENHMAEGVDVEGMDPQETVEDFEGALAVVTFMVKEEGYAPDAGDWFWGRVLPDGTVEAAGQVEGCIGCHQQAENDFVFNTTLGGGM